MKIFIGTDHGGFNLKNTIVEELNNNSTYEVFDCGALSLDLEDDYPIFAQEVCKAVLTNANSVGILLCRTGIGMSIAANKFKGIYAALCTSKEQAQRAKEHNNANVICLDSEFIRESVNLEIINTFLNELPSNHERHFRRINQIKKFEENMN